MNNKIKDDDDDDIEEDDDQDDQDYDDDFGIESLFTYRLTSVIFHTGYSWNDGHYTCNQFIYIFS
jgi:uncharacterized UBP type Zn finger protein